LESDPDSYLQLFLSLPLLAIPTTGIYFALFMVIVLLACSAMISSSEVAFFSLNINDLKKLEQENSLTSDRILTLRGKPRELLATILISNNFINIGIIILSEFILSHVLSDAVRNRWSSATLDAIPFLRKIFSLEGLADSFNFLIAVFGVTFLLVLFGEVAPKVYAKINNMKLARRMSRVLTGLTSFFKPISLPLVSGTNLIERKLSSRSGNGSITSREEIDQAIELAVKEDEKSAEKEIDILKSIVKFGDVSVKQIMRPRVDVVAIDFRIEFHELLTLVKGAGYSRLPVFDENFDNVTGILYVKDLLGHLDKENAYEWQALIRTNVMYVPEAKKINDLLRSFQLERMHMAIVVDEYGGSSGLVTLEDIMEEVIGEIKDEFDDELEVEYQKIDDLNYSFEGKTLLNDVCRVIGVDTETFNAVKGDADSVAGLLLELTGQIPKLNAEFLHENYKFKVIAVNNRRIETIQITLPEEEPLKED